MRTYVLMSVNCNLSISFMVCPLGALLKKSLILYLVLKSILLYFILELLKFCF